MKTAPLRSPQGCRVLLAGGVLGLKEEGVEVEELLSRHSWDFVLLGVPFEDLDAIRATSGEESTKEFERDATDELYLKQLARFGPVQVPPSDLYAAYRWAAARKIPVEAVDLGDEGHSAVWTENVGMLELMRNNRRLEQLKELDFRAASKEEFAREWDQALFPTKGLRRVQEEREAWMARRIAEKSKSPGHVFALIPLARWEGVKQLLLRHASFAPDA